MSGLPVPDVLLLIGKKDFTKPHLYEPLCVLLPLALFPSLSFQGHILMRSYMLSGLQKRMENKIKAKFFTKLNGAESCERKAFERQP